MGQHTFVTIRMHNYSVRGSSADGSTNQLTICGHSDAIFNCKRCAFNRQLCLRTGQLETFYRLNDAGRNDCAMFNQRNTRKNLQLCFYCAHRELTRH